MALVGLIASEVFSHFLTLAQISCCCRSSWSVWSVCLKIGAFLAVGLSVAVGVGALVTVSYVFTIINPCSSLVAARFMGHFGRGPSFGQPLYRIVAAWAAMCIRGLSYCATGSIFYSFIILRWWRCFCLRADRQEEVRYFLAYPYAI